MATQVFYGIIFLLGYLLMADARFDRAVDRHKLVAGLILGPVWCLLVAYFDVNGDPAWSGWALDILSVYSSIFAPWFCMVAFLGYGRRLFRKDGRVLRYFAPASYPIYLLHQTVIVAVGYVVLKTGLGVPLSFTAILLGSFMVCLMGYELIRRTNLLRFPFGMKIVRRSRPVLSGAGLAALRAPVPGLHADPAAGRGGRQPGDRRRNWGPPWFSGADGVQRRARPEPGVEGRSQRRRAGEDAQEHRPGPSRRPGDRDRRRGLVPGDIVLMEAGNRVPADGRLFVAANVEIEEGALTGESVASAKDIERDRRDRRRDRRPALHRVHEHLGHPRARRDDRHRHGDGDRDRSHRRPAQQDRGRQDPAAEAARPADRHHRRHGRASPSS